MEISPQLASLWAKSEPYHPLWMHSLDVAAVAWELYSVYGPIPGISRELAAFVAGVHDVGKADPFFQFQTGISALEEPLRANGLAHTPSVGGRYRHEGRSQAWLKEWLKRNLPAIDREQRFALAACVAGHHGNFNAVEPSKADCVVGAVQWSAARDALGELVRAASALERIASDPGHLSADCARLAGLIVLSDWIASNASIFEPANWRDAATPDTYFDLARTEAARTIERLRLNALPTADSSFTFAHLFPDKFPRGVQVTVADSVADEALPPGLAIIEAPMGEGKTEAALHLAWMWRQQTGAAGVYIALPTQATANQLHKRYSEFLEKNESDSSARLVHGMAWLRSDTTRPSIGEVFGDEEPERGLDYFDDWMRNSRKAMLAPHGVGTVDQALFAALNGKFGFLRLFGLARNVLIVDEVHAYDRYMATILCRLLEWRRAMQAPTILLSATLPLETRQRLLHAWGSRAAASILAYPLITAVSMDGGAAELPAQASSGRAVEVALRLHLGAIEDVAAIASAAQEAVAGEGCACVLLNTVAAAQDVFLELESRGVPPAELCLFHARFPADRRKEIEDEVVHRLGKEGDRPRRMILVATQVVEQSLDVDFDVLLTQIAPMDLLLQRMGRLWRHDRGNRGAHADPTVHIFAPAANNDEFGRTGNVYRHGRGALLRTFAVLQERAAVGAGFAIPGEIRLLTEQAYGDAPWPASLVDSASLDDAIAKDAKARDGLETDAKAVLLPHPRADEFDWAQSGFPKQEADEGDDVSWVQVRTRHGDDSRAVLVFADDGSIEFARTALAQAKRPDTDTLRSLLAKRCNVPAGWLHQRPATEDQLRTETPRWLTGCAALLMPDGRLALEEGAITFTPRVGLRLEGGHRGDAGA